MRLRFQRIRRLGHVFIHTRPREDSYAVEEARRRDHRLEGGGRRDSVKQITAVVTSR